ncbi:MAG: TetR/AcrR family transcriptional regulator [Oscillospiraceae bacterium]|nr:TetR/AcrR family transcriptional regulator [Oscillospiraceae bacterium]
MPPKAKITKEMILNAVLKITREKGFEAVNARSVAGSLQCSTRPIFTCCRSMDELKTAFLAFAYEYYERYVDDYGKAAQTSPYLVLPLSYIKFAAEEPQLFRLLFVDEMDLAMTKAGDFYKEADNEKRAAAFSRMIGIEPERARTIFLDMFFYAHGIAVLTAAKKIALDKDSAEQMMMNVLTAFIQREKPDV